MLCDSPLPPLSEVSTSRLFSHMPRACSAATTPPTASSTPAHMASYSSRFSPSQLATPPGAAHEHDAK